MYISTVESTLLASGYLPTIVLQHLPLPYSIQTLAFVGTAFCPCVDRSNDATYRHRKMRIPSFTLLAVLSYVAMIGATPLEARAPPAEVLDPRQLYVVLQQQVERF